MSILKILNWFRIVLVLGFTFVTELDFTDLSDPERRATAVKRLQEVLQKEKIGLPGFLSNYEELVLGVIIDLAVFLLKKTGLLESGKAKQAV